MIRVYSTPTGTVLESEGKFVKPASPIGIDAIFQADDALALLRGLIASGTPVAKPTQVNAPVQTQEVWASGVRGGVIGAAPRQPRGRVRRSGQLRGGGQLRRDRV